MVLKKTKFAVSFLLTPSFWDFCEINLQSKTLIHPFRMSKKIYKPAKIYLFKVNNRNSRKRCEIYPKLTIKTSKRRRFLLLILYFTLFPIVSIVDFEQVNGSLKRPFRDLHKHLLTFIRPMSHSYRNQSIDLYCKSMDWFLYGCNICLILLKSLGKGLDPNPFVIFGLGTNGWPSRHLPTQS